MKIIITHASPDWDAITSVWLIKRFLPGWEDAKVEFVPAGEKLCGARYANKRLRGNLASGSSHPHQVIEVINSDEAIHVDTGLGPLDHHETADESVSAASRTFDFVKKNIAGEKRLAVERIVRVVVDIDHFKEVFWENPTADYHEFSLLGVLEGLKLKKPNDDSSYIAFGMDCLDGLLHDFENRIWAEREIAKGMKFQTKRGQGIGFETVNDMVLPLAQKMGYAIVVRKDPRKGYVRVKARPSPNKQQSIDLTSAYEKLRKMDPRASWFLHVSKKMLLNGTVKNPKMRATKLSLGEIIKVLEKTV